MFALPKWIYKLKRRDDNPCCNLLRAKYFGDEGFYISVDRGGSQFWTGLHDIKQCSARVLIYVVKNGKKARFWLDVWLGQYPLRLTFSGPFGIRNEQVKSLYEIAEGKETLLSLR